MLREGTCLVTETAFFDDLPFSVHDAVAAHLVAQVNTDRLLRHLLPRFAKLLHGWLLLCTSSSAFHSLSLSNAGQPSHPIYFEKRLIAGRPRTRCDNTSLGLNAPLERRRRQLQP